MKKNHSVIIVAAGTGTRFGGAYPKQYTHLDNKMLLTHTIEKFLAHPDFTLIQIVIHKDHLALYQEAIKSLDTIKILPPIFGGDTRQESVLKGLEALSDYNPDTVFIHDAARPYLSQHFIETSLDLIQKHEGLVPALTVTDSLHTINNDGIIENTINRATTISVQTPQIFNFEKIYLAHQLEHKKGILIHTDDVSIAVKHGIRVKTILGEKNNIKITYAHDLKNKAPLSLEEEF